MKHRILIEFEAEHLPDDFTDQVAGRVYMMPCVKKTECTATLVGDLCTADQLRQAVIDALEMAATRCEKFGKTLDYDDGGNYAEEIRALKEQIV